MYPKSLKKLFRHMKYLQYLFKNFLENKLWKYITGFRKSNAKQHSSIAMPGKWNKT